MIDKVAIGTGILAALLSLAEFGAEKEPRARVERLDAAYQKDFADLRLARKGIFGLGRVEGGTLKNHIRRTTEAKTGRKELMATVAIFGTRGKELQPESLELRYSRWPGPVGKIEGTAPSKAAVAELLASSARKAIVGDEGPFVRTSKNWRMEVRPVRLSTRECLSCHNELQLDDPVALILYTVYPVRED